MLIFFVPWFRVITSINTRVITSAVNMLVRIPMLKVTAKPLMGPVPNQSRPSGVFAAVYC